MMASCECGCGRAPASGRFLPGHDPRLRSDLEQRVGGFLALRSIIEDCEAHFAGRLSAQAFADRARATLANRETNVDGRNRTRQ